MLFIVKLMEKSDYFRFRITFTYYAGVPSGEPFLFIQISEEALEEFRFLLPKNKLTGTVYACCEYCEDIRPNEAADYRAARSCVGEKNLINAPKCVM